MSWWNDFTGKTAKKRLSEANYQATNALNQGKSDSVGALTQNYESAQQYLSPYASAGQGANRLYANALGVNGYGAQQAFGQNYAANDPFRQQNEDFATQAISRRYNAMGSRNSGAAQLAAARALEERGSQDYNNYLSRLGQFAGQGQAVGGMQSQTASNYGNALAGVYGNFANQNASNAINYGNAQVAASNILTNNMLRNAEMAAKIMAGGK